MGVLCLQNLALVLAVVSGVSCDEEVPYEFPDGFLFGVATAAYQVEGAWNTSGKGVNIWDEFTHDHPSGIEDRSSGNVAADSYDQHKRDVEMLSHLGVDFYRFSISWSRVLPTGFIDKPNPAGINYYHTLIDELLAKGITPVVTMYHWDLPEPLQDLGGWPNAKLADYFEDYVNLLFGLFGDKVKTWITFNEPKQICQFGYGTGVFAPGIKSPGVGDYLCIYTLLNSHARAYKLYNTKYRQKQQGKGVNIWDEFTHDHPSGIEDRSSGNVAADSYDQHKRDVEMLSHLGVDFYRFSISWSRVLPTGFIDKPNPAGINYYHTLIDELLAKGITPVVTMYHWDLPEPLQDLGGWPNAKLADYFEDYVNLLFGLFGDKVKTWITFNEPKQICQFGYGTGVFAPGIKSPGVGDYLCIYTLLNSHARAYKLYNTKYRQKQQGRVGITIDMNWIKPATNSKADKAVAEEARQFQTGIYAHPIFSKQGDFPPIVKKTIAAHSKAQGLSRSRLPVFTRQQVDDLRGSADFYGLNHYSTLLASRTTNRTEKSYNVFADLVAKLYPDPALPGSKITPWLKVYPLGIRKVLNWLRDQYGDIEILITENGFSTHKGLHDGSRVKYLRENMKNVLDAIDDGVYVSGYTVWSLEDDFEWDGGYKHRFGLFEIDYDSSNRTRTARDSAHYYKNVILTGLLDPTEEDIEYAQTYWISYEI